MEHKGFAESKDGAGLHLKIIHDEKEDSHSGQTISYSPYNFRDLIETKEKEYLEGTREWVFGDVKKWLNKSHDEKSESDQKQRLLWIAAGPGVGKTVISVKLLKEVEGYIVAHHFCKHDNPAASDIRVILSSWSAMLQQHFRDEFKINIQDVHKKLGGSLEDMFEYFIGEPLRKVEVPDSPRVILLDALDEVPSESLREMLRLITELFLSLPAFMRLIVTSRDEGMIMKRLVRYTYKVEVSDVRNRADLKLFFTHVLRTHLKLDLSPPDLEVKLERALNLPENTLQGEFKDTFANVIQKSKSIFATAIDKIKTQPGYRELCAFPERRVGGMKQEENDLDRLYEDASKAHKILRDLFASEWEVYSEGKTTLERPVKGTEVSWIDGAIDPGLKKRKSAQEKIRDDYKGEACYLKDFTRFTLECDDCERMVTLLERLPQRKELTIIGIKNNFKNPTPLGYCDFNLSVRVTLPSSAGETPRTHICEVQVNVKDMLAAKEVAHVFYEEEREELRNICSNLGLSEDEKRKLEYRFTRLLRVPDLESAVKELEDRAEGLFIYASLLAREIKSQEGSFNVEKLRALPTGLHEIYHLNFARMVGTQQSEWPMFVRIISLILAAGEPLPKYLMTEIVGKGFKELQGLSVLFPVVDSRFQVMHKTLTEWLTGKEKSHQYSISPADIKIAHSALASALLKCCRPWIPGEMQDKAKFAVRHLVRHLCEASREMEANELATSLEWLLSRASLDPVGLVNDMKQVAKKLPYARPIVLLASALQMAVGTLHTWQCLPAQVVGRLIAHESIDKSVESFLRHIRSWTGPKGKWWWCLVQPMLYAAGGTIVISFKVAARVVDAKFNPTDSSYAICSCQNDLLLLDLSSGRVVQKLTGHKGVVNSLAWSAASDRVCSGSSDNSVRVWDVDSGASDILEGHDAPVTVVTWSPDGKLVLSAGEDASIKIWNVNAGTLNCNLIGHLGPILSIACMNDRICSGGADGTVRIWSMQDGAELQTLTDHADKVTAVAWCGDRQVCSGSADQTLRLWNVETGECLRVMRNHEDQVTSVAWDSSAERICSGSKDKTVKIWDAETGDCLQTLTGHLDPVNSVIWGSGDRICSGSDDTRARIWSTEKGADIKLLAGHTKEMLAMSWSIDGRYCSGGKDNTVRVWDVSSGKCLSILDETGTVNCVAWSSDGRVASGSADYSVRIWDVDNGKCVEHFVGHQNEVKAISWSCDGKVCSGSMDMTVRVWQIQQGCIQILTGHTAAVVSVAWSCDRICSGSSDKTVRIWNVDNGNCMQLNTGCEVALVMWGSDGKVCVQAEKESNVHVWDVTTMSCVYNGPLASYDGGAFWREVWKFGEESGGIGFDPNLQYSICPTNPDWALAHGWDKTTIFVLHRQGKFPQKEDPVTAIVEMEEDIQAQNCANCDVAFLFPLDIYRCRSCFHAFCSTCCPSPSGGRRHCDSCRVILVGQWKTMREVGPRKQQVISQPAIVTSTPLATTTTGISSISHARIQIPPLAISPSSSPPKSSYLTVFPSFSLSLALSPHSSLSPPRSAVMPTPPSSPIPFILPPSPHLFRVWPFPCDLCCGLPAALEYQSDRRRPLLRREEEG